MLWKSFLDQIRSIYTIVKSHVGLASKRCKNSQKDVQRFNQNELKWEKNDTISQSPYGIIGSISFAKTTLTKCIYQVKIHHFLPLAVIIISVHYAACSSYVFSGNSSPDKRLILSPKYLHIVCLTSFYSLYIWFQLKLQWLVPGGIFSVFVSSQCKNRSNSGISPKKDLVNPQSNSHTNRKWWGSWKQNMAVRFPEIATEIPWNLWRYGIKSLTFFRYRVCFEYILLSPYQIHLLTIEIWSVVTVFYLNGVDTDRDTGHTDPSLIGTGIVLFSPIIFTLT